MTVVSDGPLCLKIHLNKHELKKYFICYDNINFSDPEIKKTISVLFDIAVNKADFETSGKRIIEVFPTASGGCILKFTSEPIPVAPHSPIDRQSKNIRLKSSKEDLLPYIFAFSNFEALLSVIENLSKNRSAKRYKCDLFIMNNKYYISIFIPVFDRKSAMLLNEFSDYSAKGIKQSALLEEHAKCLIKENTIGYLNKIFFKEL